ncbi:MAG: c-type cytochrome [Gammaproteobacteria bacterium]
MSKTVKIGWVSVCVLAAGVAGAQVPEAPATAPAEATPNTVPHATGSAEEGAGKAAVCLACHGMNGNSTNPEWPNLAGQPAVYTAEQLRLFRATVRNNPVMVPLAATLTDDDIADLAVYYETQTPAGLEADPSYWKAGEALYRNGDSERQIPACIACHGPVGRGNLAAGYPALRAQHSVYTVKQLTDYANDARYRVESADIEARNGHMMSTIAKRLTAEDIRNLASYIQGMR